MKKKLKSFDEIYDVLYHTPTDKLDLYSMEYVDGVVDALKWVIGEKDDRKKKEVVKKPFTDYDD